MAASDRSALRQLGETLHQKLVDGDPTAPAQIAEEFFQLVITALRRKYPVLHDPDLVDAAADKAIMNYFSRPSQYDPRKLSLHGFLFMSARHDLLNALREQQIPGLPRQKDPDSPKKVQVVELDALDWELETEVDDGSLSIEEQVEILSSPILSKLEALFPSPVDQEVLTLMLDGIRDTTEYSAILGIAGLPQQEQESEVKRHKDRIKKRIQRHIDSSDLISHD
jgi:RNA polymerase sigma-70 factor, ECF subfamily